MINTPVIICSDYNAIESNDFFDLNEVIYSLVFDSTDYFNIFSLDVIHRQATTTYQQNCFSIYFDFTLNSDSFTDSISNFKELVLQYFFHPNYKIIQNKPLVCLNSKDADIESVQKVISEIEKYAILQGYEGLEFIYFSDKNSNIKNNFIFNSEISLDHFASTYMELLLKNQYASKYIGIKESKAKAVILTITEVENKLARESPDYYNHLKEFRKLKEDFLTVSKKLKLTTEELSNQKQYLKIYKDQDESLKINEFYHNEYEILPLWYKKLGHIIKVLIGKRTFRSLFDNNVKKYKN